MFLSIDIGGSKTLLALFTSFGLCYKRRRFETPSRSADFLSELRENLAALFPSDSSKVKLRALTVAIPGVVRVTPEGVSFHFGNLRWGNLDLLTPLREFFPAQSVKIFFVNDANLATLYEASRPLRRRKKSAYLTFSTGIGGGLAKNGRLLPASDTFEPGHKSYLWQDKSLEWEDIASGKALSEAYASPLKDLSLDRETANDLISRLSLGLVDILKSEAPELLIIGGPLGFIINKLKTPLLHSLKISLATAPLPDSTVRALDHLKIKRARRPTESVIYGGYLYSKQNYRK
ncbi:ROK family protein [Candidatus Saccharibacteria bacterium]|nr:ROK family protein [Candidatus Saccharibacteria bacterium]